MALPGAQSSRISRSSLLRKLIATTSPSYCGKPPDSTVNSESNIHLKYSDTGLFTFPIPGVSDMKGWVRHWVTGICPCVIYPRQELARAAMMIVEEAHTPRLRFTSLLLHLFDPAINVLSEVYVVMPQIMLPQLVPAGR